MSLFPSLGQLWSRPSQPTKSRAPRRRRMCNDKRALSGKRGLLFESLEGRVMLALVNFTESSDLSGETPTAFTIDRRGINVWQGTLLTPGDSGDAIEVTVALGLEITGIRFRYEDTFRSGFQNQDRDQVITLNGSGGATFSHGFSVPFNQGGLVVDVTNSQFTLPATLPFTGTTTIFIGSNVAFPAAPWVLELIADPLIETNPTIDFTDATPTPAQAGSTTVLEVGVSPGANPASSGLAVTGDLSSIGGSATQAFFDDGTNGDATAGDGIYSFLATVSTSTTAGPKTLPVTVTDAQMRSASGSISLDVTAAIPTISINDVTVNEGASAATFTVSLSAASGQTVTVNYAIANGTAVGTEDYTKTSGTLTFAPGDMMKTFMVDITDDPLDEFDETFFVNLSAATNATIADNQGQGTISDNDAPPTVSVSDATVTEGGTFIFNVSLSAASQKVISVFVQTEPGTAARDDDFGWGSIPLTFNPGQTSIGVLVNTVDDPLDEDVETMTLELTQPVNVTIADASGLGTINDNDQAPTVTSPTSTNIEVTTATLGGNVTSEGTAATTERGIVYAITSVNNNPQIGGPAVTKVATTGTTGIFTIDVGSLPSGTQLSFAAYATSPAGTSYSSVGMFTTQPLIGQLPGITVQILGGVMIITGTEEDDTIKVASDGASGFIVTANKLINGLPSPQTFSGAMSFVGNTLGGNDDLWLAAPLAFDGVTIDLGDDNDRLVLGADPNNPVNNDVSNPAFGTQGYLTVNGPVQVLGGDGDDTVWERTTLVNGVKSIDLGNGANRYDLYWSISNETNFSGGADIDTVFLGYLTAREESMFETGGDNDLLSVYGSRFNKEISFFTGGGRDSLALDVNIFDQALTADTGGEADYLLFSRSIAFQSVALTTGDGGDFVYIGRYIAGVNAQGTAIYENGGSTVDQLTLKTGGGLDVAQITANVIRDFFADLGDIRDDVQIDYNLFDTRGLLDGGLNGTKLRARENRNLRLVNI
ncbi:MAG: Calx-beta domain-containing protein [Pirellulales bacterium]|nr:Calx-beta domain-containing protein [Pirellulales bacterium]